MIAAIYFVRASEVTPDEPTSGWYFCLTDCEQTMGPFPSREDAAEAAANITTTSRPAITGGGHG